MPGHGLDQPAEAVRRRPGSVGLSARPSDRWAVASLGLVSHGVLSPPVPQADRSLKGGVRLAMMLTSLPGSGRRSRP